MPDSASDRLRLPSTRSAVTLVAGRVARTGWRGRRRSGTWQQAARTEQRPDDGVAVLAGLVAGCLLVPISASAAGAVGTGKATYATKVSGLCRSYATTFAQAGAKVGSGSPSGAAPRLAKAVSKAQAEVQITSVPS